MKHYGDICKINGADVEPVDVITGGSPCQDLSVAGKRAGLAGERSGLFMEQIRIIKEMREHEHELHRDRTDESLRPRYMVWENVYGAFSSNGGEDFRAVLEETAKVAQRDAVIPRLADGQKWPSCGYIMGDRWSIAWRGHDAQYWGVPQRRKRVCMVADFNGQSAPFILFDPQYGGETEYASAFQTVADPGDESRPEIQSVSEGMSGNTEPCGQTGEGTPCAAEDSVRGTMRCLNPWDVQSKHVQPTDGIAEALYSGECRGGGGESYVMTNTVSFTTEMTPKTDENGVGFSLRSRDYKDPQAVVYGMSPYHSNAMLSDNPHSGIYEADTSRTLDLNGGSPACNQGGMIVLEGNGSRDSHRGDGYAESEVSYTLNTVEQHAVLTQPQQNEPYQKVTGTLSPGAHAGSYNGQDAYNDMLIVQEKKNPSYGLDRASFNQGQNAKFDFSVEEELAPTVVLRGPGGGTDGTVGPLCARDWKGVGTQYVNEGKVIIQRTDTPEEQSEPCNSTD